jgi:hypothetical protein
MSLPFTSRPMLVAALAVLAVAAQARAQGGAPGGPGGPGGPESYRFVSLRVSDAGTQAPLPGVRVTVQGISDREWSTDEQGAVLVAVARGGAPCSSCGASATRRSPSTPSRAVTGRQ